MTEDILHFIWKYKLFKPVPLVTTQKEEVMVIKPGDHNPNAGPDFMNARLRISGMEWAGTVEIHKKSSDWFAHQHHLDRAYDNVILHVVYEHDKEVVNTRGEPIACLELKFFLQEGVLKNYENLCQKKQEIPCGSLFKEVPHIIREPWLERMLIERLERKIQFIEGLFRYTQNNWDETLYLLLCKNFGFHINGEAFLQIGKSIPLTVLLKHRASLVQLEAMLLGQGGLLQREPAHPYARELQKEYQYLQHKYQLKQIPHPLHFLRLRPSNFPGVRLAQLAAYIFMDHPTFSKMIEADTIFDVKKLFQIKASSYWSNHYTFQEAKGSKEKKLGDASIENILSNTVLPLLFFYGKVKQEARLMEKAVKGYDELKPEKNSVSHLFEQYSFKTKHAGHSQAMIHLNEHYCSQKKCMQCGIGAYILRKK